MVENIRPREFVRRHESGELWQLLDVRELWEIEVASVSDSIQIPMGEIGARHAELDRRRPVAVLCHTGIRSAHVAAYLARSGFATVANIAGGIDAWSNEVDSAVPRY